MGLRLDVPFGFNTFLKSTFGRYTVQGFKLKVSGGGGGGGWCEMLKFKDSLGRFLCLTSHPTKTLRPSTLFAFGSPRFYGSLLYDSLRVAGEPRQKVWVRLESAQGPYMLRG